jgi:hypothetical protein
LARARHRAQGREFRGRGRREFRYRFRRVFLLLLLSGPVDRRRQYDRLGRRRERLLRDELDHPLCGRVRRRLHLKGYLGFALSQIMGFFANTATIWCLVELLFVPAWAAKVAAIAVSFVVNFSLSHFLVFRAQPRQNVD